MEYSEETEMVDYSADPLEGFDIFGYSSHAVTGCSTDFSAVSRVPIPSSILPFLPEAPPTSPDPAALLQSFSSADFTIDFSPHRNGPPEQHIPHDPLPATSVGISPASNPSIPSSDAPDLRHYPPVSSTIKTSGSFSTPALIPQALNRSPRASGSHPLADHPTAPRSKKTKCVRETAKDISVQLGDPTNFEESMALARTTLVGHVRGRSFSAERLKAWANEIWGEMFTVMPEVIELPRGWFSIHFAEEEHTNTVLAQYWHIESAPVLLKRWSPLFDPEREQIGAGPIWVRLPGLPIQYWSEEAFIKIGNALGTYLDHDRSYMNSNKKIMARILVYLDTREGLEGKMTLRWGSFSNAQLLDYEGVPFRCNKCRQIGHVYKDCPLIIGQEGRPKKSRPSAGGDSAPAPTPQRTSGRTIGARSSVHQSTPIPPASEHEHHRPASSPPLTRARAAAAAANISGSITGVPTSFPRRRR